MNGIKATWEIPADAASVLEECVDEAWRSVEQDEDYRPVDIAADIVRRLTTVYGL